MFLWIIGLVLLASFYLHCIEQYKMGDELMVYETDYESRDQLLKACALKQPLVFSMPPSRRPPVTPLEQWEGLMRIVDTNKKYKNDAAAPAHVRFVSARHAATVLAAPPQVPADETTPLLSEGNDAWILENIPLLYDMRSLDALWRPSWTVQTNYDVLAAAAGATTRFRWHFDSSRFFYVSTGCLRIKMTPFSHAAAFANPQYNYSAFEFSSSLDVWSPTDKLAERMKFVDFEVPAGSAFYIPPYWWYSFQIGGDGDGEAASAEKKQEITQVYAFTYRTCVNILAHGHHWARWFIKNQYSGFDVGVDNKNSEQEKNEKIDLFEKIERCGIDNQQTTTQKTQQTVQKTQTQQTQKTQTQTETPTKTSQNIIDVAYNQNADPEISAERCSI
jgi:hypothetical protein